MIEALLNVIPIEKHGMSIFTVLVILGLILCCYFLVIIIFARIKYLNEKGKMSFLEVEEKHSILRTDFEKARDLIHEKLESSYKDVFGEIKTLNASISKLNEFSVEGRANNNNIAKNIDNIQKDFRDFKNRKD